jgi:hypothetical protein
MAAKSRERFLELFTTAKMVDAVEAVYDEIIGTRVKPGNPTV